jgi:hypothetical protein
MKPLYQTALLSGLLAAFICLGYSLVLYSIEQNPFGRFKYLYIGFYGACFAMAMFYYRDRQNNGRMRAQEGILLGFIINATAAVVYGSLLLLVMESIPNNILQLYHNESIAILEASKEILTEQLGEGVYEETYQNVLKTTTRDLALDQAIGVSMTGFFLTFLFMLIFKN